MKQQLEKYRRMTEELRTAESKTQQRCDDLESKLDGMENYMETNNKENMDKQWIIQDLQNKIEQHKKEMQSKIMELNKSNKELAINLLNENKKLSDDKVVYEHKLKELEAQCAEFGNDEKMRMEIDKLRENFLELNWN